MKKLFFAISLITLCTNLNSAEESPTSKKTASDLDSKTLTIINEIKKSTVKHNKPLFKTHIAELRELYPSSTDFTNILIPHINDIMAENTNNERNHFYLKTLLENGFDINVDIKSAYNEEMHSIGSILLVFNYNASTYLEILSNYSMNPNAEVKMYDSPTNSLRASRPALYVILDLLYEKEQSKEIITEIVTLLLKLGSNPAIPGKFFNESNTQGA